MLSHTHNHCRHSWAYTSHDISEIANSKAGQSDIDACEAELGRIIEYAQQKKKKCACFVTGVPGAGKTLVGLDVVAKNLRKGEKSLSVYLSGNKFLVDALRAVLIKSVQTKGKNKKSIEVSVNAMIQNSIGFKKDNVRITSPTPEHILIFDEAQRVLN